MGMYDQIQCDAPLPDGYNGASARFQTKSFPDPGMQGYKITGTGKLTDALGNDLEPDGYITFLNLGAAKMACHVYGTLKSAFGPLIDFLDALFAESSRSQRRARRKKVRCQEKADDRPTQLRHDEPDDVNRGNSGKGVTE
jgi:hypothetical protein